VIPAQDFPDLKAIGVANVFGPGALTDDIVKFIQEKIKK